MIAKNCKLSIQQGPDTSKTDPLIANLGPLHDLEIWFKKDTFDMPAAELVQEELRVLPICVEAESGTVVDVFWHQSANRTATEEAPCYNFRLVPRDGGRIIAVNFNARLLRPFEEAVADAGSKIQSNTVGALIKSNLLTFNRNPMSFMRVNSETGLVIIDALGDRFEIYSDNQSDEQLAAAGALSKMGENSKIWKR